MADNEGNENTAITDEIMQTETDGVEEMNSDNYDNSNSDTSDSGSEDNESIQNELKVQDLLQKIEESPFLYDSHVELIKILRQMGELGRLRDAREKMSELFPLTEELWLDWLRDEIPLATEENERSKLEQLFERAVKDYLSVQIWLEYVQYSIGGMGLKGGVDRIRAVAERALTAAGLHVTRGAYLWEAYREFENAILAGLLPVPGKVATQEQEDLFKAQHQRVNSLFKRQLSIPLFDMTETYCEYKDWLQEELDSFTEQTYKKVCTRLDKVKPLEESLEASEAPRLEEYKTYIKIEMKEGDPTRIQCLFERAIQENSLNSDLWLQYTKYLDEKLKVKSVVLPVYERSVRNCPWCGKLWHKYMLAMERYQEPNDKVKELIDKALLAGFSSSADYLLVWSTYIDYLRRRIKWDEEHKEALELFRLTLEKAVEHLAGFEDGDPFGTLRQYWANIEAKFCTNLTKARELWNEIMTEGHGSEATMWLEFYKMERMYGNNKHCRRVLTRALNSVTDWPESVVEAYTNFEREEGNIEDYDTAVTKCEAQMARIMERRQQAAEKEAAVKEQKKQGKSDKKSQKKGQKGTDQQGTNRFQGKQRSGGEQRSENWSQSANQKEKTYEDSENDGQKKAEKRKFEESSGQSNDFKVPPPPGFKGPKSGSQGPPPGYKGPKSGSAGPPPGFKGHSNNSSESPAKKRKLEADATGQHGGDGDFAADPSAQNRTAFVSNLDFSIGEDKLGEIFSECGELTDIRIAKNFKGKSKGFAYIEFKDEFGAMNAIKLDRKLVENRPMYVSKYEEKGKSKAQFRYSIDLEKNKLFVSGLPFTCTKDALQVMFGAHGQIKDVRLVTYKSGAPKGLAYVEYVDAQDAKQAVLKADGMLMGDHTISVSISNPPGRKTPLNEREDPVYTPTLGSGKKETETRGKARTQLMLLPRSIKKAPVSGGPVKTSANQNSANETDSNGDSAQSATKMSNADFRNMLLKK
ncbi:squamous cell carcinoma antigen recognized by T-cells 3-like [Mizuhopecten yessoensis]|uniref:Squamous cell carcinoma antigen recognized by T-cells 3 n=1 Tax=Mizuhopecten yessoensis TaxID=6573 RepID=A0A210PRJ6_MIZYE|nr:squamous cell carcinoma antigen recognized by T-cells 3-like [Mizuhopecten yessoensis]OWF39137.1 Squamous cell carcinoma antigen recognized by T-cells 3 [Mizuhopecten yessoensis]